MIAATIRKALIIAAASLGCLAGCQNMHETNIKVAEARWSRARASVMAQLAEQQYANGQFDKALVTVGKALELDPNYPRLQILRGKVLAEKGQGTAAVSSFELALALDVRSHEAHYQLGVMLERYGQLDKALEHYEAAQQIQPTNTAYGVAVAEVMARLERPDDALKLLDGMLALEEQSVALRATAAEICAARGDHARAVTYLRDAVRMAPDDTGVERSLAMALYHDGRHDEARPHLQQLLANDPRTGDDALVARGELLTALGDCYLVNGRLREARDCFQQVTMLHPTQAGAWVNLAKVDVGQSRWGDAQASADRAIALSPTSATAHLLKGFALSNQGYLSESASSFATAHQLAPTDVVSLCMLSDSYRRLGNYQAARSALIRALEVRPNDKLAGQMLQQLANAEFAKTPATAGVRVEN